MDWRLCLIADTETVGRENVIPAIKDAVEAGVSIIQLRGKKLETRDFLGLSLQAAEALRRRNIPLIINDRVDICLACGADGVHLGQDDLPLKFARKILGKERLVGISINTAEEAMEAEREGADYLGVGPVFFTQTKFDLRPPVGLEGFRIIRKRVKIPILAIGGINSENAGEVMRAGSDGVAVISAIMASNSIKRATRNLLKAITKISISKQL